MICKCVNFPDKDKTRVNSMKKNITILTFKDWPMFFFLNSSIYFTKKLCLSPISWKNTTKIQNWPARWKRHDILSIGCYTWKSARDLWKKNCFTDGKTMT